MLSAFISSLKVTVMFELKGTFVAPLIGVVLTTTGQTPGVSMYFSFLQPKMSAVDRIAKVAISFNFFNVVDFLPVTGGTSVKGFSHHKGGKQI
jgi:hypothetical protein